MSDATTTLHDRYGEALGVAERLAAAMYSGWSHERREDLVQLVMQNLWRHFAADGWPDNLQAFLRTAVRNTARNLHHMEDRRRSAPAGLGGTFEALGAVPLEGWLNEFRLSPSVLAARQQALDDLFALLSIEDAQLLRLRFVDNVPTRLVAQELGLHPDSVSRAVARAIRRLKSALVDHPEMAAAL